MLRKQIVYLLVMVSVAIVALLPWIHRQLTASAAAETVVAAPTTTLTVQTFRGRFLDPAETRLKKTEAFANSIETQKLIRGNESEELATEAYEYAMIMKSAFDEAMSQAKLAADTQGQQGNAALVREFETLAKVHEGRTKKLSTQAERIDTNIKNYTIKLDRGMFQRMQETERREYQNYLNVQGRTKLRSHHPDLFIASPSGRGNGGGMAKLGSFRPQGIGNAFIAGGEDEGAADEAHTDLHKFEALEPATTPYYAAPCVGPCYAKQWAVCKICVVQQGPKAIEAYNTFVSEWNGSCSCKWYKPWCCTKKMYYLAKLIAKLA